MPVEVEVLVLGLFTCGLLLLVEERFTVLPIDEREAELLLVTAAALFLGEAVATLRLPAAAALEVDAGRRPWAMAPVEMMVSPQASIKPIIVL